jgi:hypothetical protein
MEPAAFAPPVSDTARPVSRWAAAEPQCPALRLKAGCGDFAADRYPHPEITALVRDNFPYVL